jgi:AraC family transcriptional regulator
VTKYQDRFVEVINYIEANLDLDLDTVKLCQLAYLSKYHFHRQCSAFFGMPVMSIVKLLRLKRAAYQLAYRDEKIVNIALANGYESHEAFSRAFKKQFNKSPSDFRRSPDWTPWHSQYEPILKLRTKIMSDNVNFDTKIIDFPKTLIATMEHREAPSLLGNTIKNFIEWRKENRLPPSKNKTFNLVYDDPNITAPENYRFDVCCSIDNLVEKNSYGIVNKVIPAGKCAVVRHIGSDDSISLAVNYLYSEWLNNSSFEVRDFPVFFERVSFFPEVLENEMITDVYLPIE